MWEVEYFMQRQSPERRTYDGKGDQMHRRRFSYQNDANWFAQHVVEHGVLINGKLCTATYAHGPREVA